MGVDIGERAKATLSTAKVWLKGGQTINRLSILSVIVFILLIFGSTAACQKTCCNCTVITSDGIFTMSPSGSYPAFHYDGVYNRTYIGFYSSDSKVNLLYWDEDAKELSDSVNLWSDWGDGDDHAGPSVLVLQHQTGENAIHNGKILVATSGVRPEPPLQVRSSTNPEDISRWEDPITFDWDGLYPVLEELSDGTIYIFYMKRDIPNYGDRTQCYKTSVDGGTTWSDRTILFQADGSRRIYGIYYLNSNANQIHAMFNRCPLEPEFGSWYRDIYYAYYDKATDSWKRQDGTGYTLPITPSTAELVYESDTTPGKEDHTWLSDIKVDSDDNPYLISITNVDYAYTGHTPGINPEWDGVVQRHSYQDGSWITEVISENGAGQFGSYSYPAMAILDEEDMDTVYLTPYDDEKKTSLQKWQRIEATWTKVEDITQAYPGYHFRPTYVRNAAGFKVIWCYSERYEHHQRDKWESMLFAYPGLSH
jgi:hypothetical protein